MTFEIEGIEKVGEGRNLRVKFLVFFLDIFIRVVKWGLYFYNFFVNIYILKGLGVIIYFIFRGVGRRYVFVICKYMVVFSIIFREIRKVVKNFKFF